MWQHIQRTRIIGLGSKAAGGRDYVLFTEDGWGGDACGELCESGATHDEPGSREAHGAGNHPPTRSIFRICFSTSNTLTDCVTTENSLFAFLRCFSASISRTASS